MSLYRLFSDIDTKFGLMKVDNNVYKSFLNLTNYGNTYWRLSGCVPRGDLIILLKDALKEAFYKKYIENSFCFDELNKIYNEKLEDVNDCDECLMLMGMFNLFGLIENKINELSQREDRLKK